MRCHPAAQRRELDRVGLVSHGEAEALELRDDLAPNSAGLDARDVVLRIDPQDLVHATHVDRDDHALVLSGAAQCLRHVRSAPVGDETDVMCGSCLDKCNHLLLVAREDDQIRNALQLCVLDRVHLLLRVSVSVAEPEQRLVGDRVVTEELSQLLQELGLRSRGWNDWRVL